jgi:hypothetical protein
MSCGMAVRRLHAQDEVLGWEVAWEVYLQDLVRGSIMWSDLESVGSLAVSVVDRDTKRVERSRATLRPTRPKRRACPKTGSQMARGHSFGLSSPHGPHRTLSEPHPLPDLRYSQRSSRHRPMWHFKYSWPGLDRCFLEPA